MAKFHQHEAVYAARHADILQKNSFTDVRKRHETEVSVDYAIEFARNSEIDQQATAYLDQQKTLRDCVDDAHDPLLKFEKGLN
jgi:hypothetical protein